MRLTKRLPILLLAALLLCGLFASAEAPENTLPPEDDAPQPANGYVLVTSATQTGWLPLPAEGEYSDRKSVV